PSTAALLFSMLAPLIFILQFLLGREVLDPFLRKRPSQNVIGRLRKPGGNSVKRLLILGGHHDSAPENTWFLLLHALHSAILRRWRLDAARADAWLRRLALLFYLFSATFFIGFAVLLVLNAVQLVGVLTGDAATLRAGTLGWALLVFPMLPAMLYGLFTIRGTKNGGNVPGAADNLSACALTVAMCRFLVEHPDFIPEDTEIRFISFGCEEAGLRGSRRYVARHLDELKRLDARLLNFETVAHPEITILSSDANGTVQNSARMVQALVAAAGRAGVPFRVKAASIGEASDAAPFSRAGLWAATLQPFQTPQQLIGFYHQKWDTPEVLTLPPLLNVLKLTLEWIRANGE
ncbi:Zn-dependent exopeptidase M28, partial [bacterium]